MTQKYLSPYTGKMVSAHQFLADLVLFHRGEGEIWKDQKDAKAQFVAAAKISKQFTDEFDLVIKVVVEKRAKSLLPFIWKKYCIMKLKIFKPSCIHSLKNFSSSWTPSFSYRKFF